MLKFKLSRQRNGSAVFDLEGRESQKTPTGRGLRSSCSALVK